jgi:hypothetical protein
VDEFGRASPHLAVFVNSESGCSSVRTSHTAGYSSQDVYRKLSKKDTFLSHADFIHQYGLGCRKWLAEYGSGLKYRCDNLCIL